jgi:hypothetical protein
LFAEGLKDVIHGESGGELEVLGIAEIGSSFHYCMPRPSSGIDRDGGAEEIE